MRKQQARMSEANRLRRMDIQHDVTFMQGDPVLLFENIGVRSDGKVDNSRRSKEGTESRKTALTSKFLYRLSGVHTISKKVSRNAYEIIDYRTNKKRLANVANLKLYTPWNSDWDQNQEELVQDFEERPINPLVDDICIIRCERKHETDRPFEVAKILHKYSDGRLRVHWLGSINNALFGKYTLGYIDPRDQKVVYGRSMKRTKRSHIPYTNYDGDVCVTPLKVSDVAYTGVELTPKFYLPQHLIDAIRDDETISTTK